MALAVSVPDNIEMLVGEQLNFKVDFTNLIAAGDVISSILTVDMKSLTTNELAPTAIIGSPFISSGVFVNVTISSLTLRPKTNYLLQLTCTATGGATTKVISVPMTIQVIY